MGYRRRIIDDVLDEFIPELAAVALEGAKGVGKTATALERVSSTVRVDIPGRRAAIQADPEHVMRLEPPVLIDEWQLEPYLWDYVRHAVDSNSSGGQFVLTGSAGVAPGFRVHSGAGRIVSLLMRPLSIHERGIETSTVSLSGLFERSVDPVEGSSEIGLSEYVDEMLRSGFPGIRNLPARARNAQLDSYVSRIVERDLPDNGAVIRRPRELTAWLRAYAAATSTTASYSTILDAATPGEGDKPARQTVAGYRDHLERIFVLDPLPAWVPALTPLKRLSVTPKHHLCDPALAARLISVAAPTLLEGEGERVGATEGPLVGALFESLVTQSVRVYAEAIEANVNHFRNKDGTREVDLIVETPDRRVVAIEVKLAATVGDDDVRHLKWLRGVLGDRMADMVIVTTGSYAYRRPDGVAVVPLALLGS